MRSFFNPKCIFPPPLSRSGLVDLVSGCARDLPSGAGPAGEGRHPALPQRRLLLGEQFVGHCLNLLFVGFFAEGVLIFLSLHG